MFSIYIDNQSVKSNFETKKVEGSYGPYSGASGLTSESVVIEGIQGMSECGNNFVFQYLEQQDMEKLVAVCEQYGLDYKLFNDGADCTWVNPESNFDNSDTLNLEIMAQIDSAML